MKDRLKDQIEITETFFVESDIDERGALYHALTNQRIMMLAQIEILERLEGMKLPQQEGKEPESDMVIRAWDCLGENVELLDGVVVEVSNITKEGLLRLKNGDRISIHAVKRIIK